MKPLSIHVITILIFSFSMTANASTFTCSPEMLIQNSALTGGTGTGEGGTPGGGASVTFETGVSVSNFRIDLESGTAETDLKIIDKEGNQKIDSLRTQCEIVMNQELYGNKKNFFCQADVSRFSYLKLDVTVDLDKKTVSFFDPDFIITTIHGGSALRYGNASSAFANGKIYQTKDIPLAENGMTICPETL